MALDEFLVVMMLVSLPALPVVEEAALKLKQYRVAAVKSPLEKVTDCPETPVAGLPIEGQTVASVGKLLVLVVQLLAFWETLKSSGN